MATKLKRPTIVNLENTVQPFNGDSKKYIRWRNHLETVFKSYLPEPLFEFGVFSGNPDEGYTRRAHNYRIADPAVDPKVFCNASTWKEIMAKVSTKLSEAALDVYEENKDTALSWFRSDVNNDANTLATIPDQKGYSVAHNHSYN